MITLSNSQNCNQFLSLLGCKVSWEGQDLCTGYFEELLYLPSFGAKHYFIDKNGDFKRTYSKIDCSIVLYDIVKLIIYIVVSVFMIFFLIYREHNRAKLYCSYKNIEKPHPLPKDSIETQAPLGIGKQLPLEKREVVDLGEVVEVDRSKWSSVYEIIMLWFKIAEDKHSALKNSFYDESGEPLVAKYCKQTAYDLNRKMIGQVAVFENGTWGPIRQDNFDSMPGRLFREHMTICSSMEEAIQLHIEDNQEDNQAEIIRSQQESWDTVLLYSIDKNPQSIALYDSKVNKLGYLVTHPDNLKDPSNKNPVSGGARKIMEYLIKRSIEKGEDLKLHSFNTSLGFYEKCGFKRASPDSNDMVYQVEVPLEVA